MATDKTNATPAETDEDSPFTNAASGYGPKPKDLVGRLLILTPTKYREGIKTKFNPSADSVDGTLVIVDETDPTKSETDRFSFMQGRLVGGLKDYVGRNKMVLGRMGTVPTDKGNDAYVLEDPTPDDVRLGKKYLDSVDPFEDQD